MKKLVLFLIIVVFTILISLLIIINLNCTNVYGDSFMNSNNKNHINNSYEIEEVPIASTQLVIYKLQRDNFHLFLEKTSITTLKNVCSSSKLIPEGFETWYTTCNYTRFLVTQDLQNFLYDDDRLYNYLSQHKYNGNIKNIAILDIPNMPLTIWVNISTENIFITINNTPEKSEYKYELYSLSDFTEKYRAENGTLVLNTKKIETTIKPTVYYDYADIPFLAVIEALGGKVYNYSSNKSFIQLNSSIFVLNKQTCSIYKLLEKDNNFFHNIDGGAVFTYSVGKEFMVDSKTLKVVFREMGIDVEFNIDTNDNVVSITVH